MDFRFKNNKNLSITKLTNKVLISFHKENFDEDFNIPNYIQEYMSNLFTLKLENQFTNLFEENLSKIFVNFEINLTTKKMESFSFSKFLLLVEFFCKDDSKIFQIYFRKTNEYENLIDYLLYDIQK